MKNYLLVLLGSLLLLFALPKQNSLRSVAGTEQGEIKKACGSKRLVKRTCAKKCLKHQTHSEQKNAASHLTECNQQLYAVVAAQPSENLFSCPTQRTNVLQRLRRHLAPELEYDPHPPRLS